MAAGERFWQAVTWLPAWVFLLYVAASPLFAGLGWLSRRGTAALVLTLVAGLALWAFAGVVAAVTVLDAEDWWDDFREQHLGAVAAVVVHLAAPPAAYLWGRTLGG